jgi:hypothetical protein
MCRIKEGSERTRLLHRLKVIPLKTKIKRHANQPRLLALKAG